LGKLYDCAAIGIHSNIIFSMDGSTEKSNTTATTGNISVPNATVGRFYEHVFDTRLLGHDEIIDFNVEASDHTGLIFDREENKLSGTPKDWGEYTLVLSYRTKDTLPAAPSFRKEVKIIINPNPKSLWKDLPSDADGQYAKEDNASSSGAFCNRKIIIGSKRGRSHAHEGRYRDDDFTFINDTATGWGIVVVADGAGSAKYSRKGSQIACHTVADYFLNANENRFTALDAPVAAFLADRNDETQKNLSTCFVEHIGKAAFAAQAAIREESITANAEIRDFATTLIFAVMKHFEAGYVIGSFWVGDGGIGIFDRGKSAVTVLGTPDSGEFAGQTRFLTQSDIFANNAYVGRIKMKIVDDFTALVLMTDGITDPKFQTDNNLSAADKWNELWEDLEGKKLGEGAIDFEADPEIAERQLMNWLDFWSPGNHDDRTMAIIY
jgi:serine/threonine protein phosphatase PrpC